MYIVRHVDCVCSDLSPSVIAASVIDRRWDDKTADVKEQNHQQMSIQNLILQCNYVWNLVHYWPKDL